MAVNPSHKKSYVVSVTGGSGCGKSYFLSRLMLYFSPEQICLFSQDNYYIPREQQTKDEQGVTNFDLPASFNNEDFLADLKRLKAGQPVSRPQYLYNIPNAAPQIINYLSAPLLIVEGLFVQYWEDIRDETDYAVFIDASPATRLSRRLARDFNERGYGPEDVIYRFERHVDISYRQYILPQRPRAHLIIDNEVDMENAVKKLADFLKNKVA